MSVRRHALLFARVALAIVVLAGVVRMTLFTVYRVSGTSMQEALQDGDRIFVFDPSWVREMVGVGDTVVLEVDGEVLVKRIVAGPGDHIAMQRGLVLRNGRVVHEEIPAGMNASDSFPDTPLADDEFFVLGDHRRVSVDSRDFGPVPREHLRGMVLMRMPPSGGLAPVAALERS
ncbi:MAG: signal peptidase I [Planctomycetes bacterium]|nr:signal peptidase I [Planctomycetota bacterium]